MPDARLKRTRDAYKHEPTQEEINNGWLKVLDVQPIIDQSRIYVDRRGETRVVRSQTFCVRK